MQFSYKAKNEKGRILKGKIEANDLSSATISIKQKGLFLIDVVPESSSKSIKFFQKKVAVKDKIIFAEQLAIMLKSGLSIIDALSALREEATNSNFASKIEKVIFDIKSGTPLSKALEKHPEVWSEIDVNMVKSGEESGKLESVLQRLSDQMKKDYELSRKIKGALSYPVFVLIALVGVVALVMIVVIPQLKLIFDDAGVKLPALTRVIIAISLFLKKDGVYLFVFLIALFVSLIRFNKTEKGREIFDRLKLKIPVIGGLLRKTYVSRFTRTFAALTASGLPLIEVFEVSSRVVGNVLYEKEIASMGEQIKAGHSISATLKKSELMPKMVGQLSSVGEKSGNVDEVFNTLADFFDRDIDAITANLSILLEPILMVVMGAAIGLIIMSVLQPIYGLVNAI